MTNAGCRLNLPFVLHQKCKARVITLSTGVWPLLRSVLDHVNLWLRALPLLKVLSTIYAPRFMLPMIGRESARQISLWKKRCSEKKRERERV